MEREKISTEPLKTATGFTLVEIMIVVVIIGIIALLAAPAMINFGPNMRIKGAARDLHSSIQKMKSEGVKRNSNIVMLVNPVVCGGLPGAVPSPGGSYQMFIDDDNSGAHNGSEEWLSFADNSGDASPDTDYDMPKNTAICISTAASFGFNSRGIFLNPAATITLNNDRGLTYTVDVSLAGSVKTQKL